MRHFDAFFGDFFMFKDDKNGRNEKGFIIVDVFPLGVLCTDTPPLLGGIPLKRIKGPRTRPSRQGNPFIGQ